MTTPRTPRQAVSLDDPRVRVLLGGTAPEELRKKPVPCLWIRGRWSLNSPQPSSPDSKLRPSDAFGAAANARSPD